jgi:hypothetical protein
MEVMFERVAGLDVGKVSVTVCVRTHRRKEGTGAELRGAGTRREPSRPPHRRCG